MSKITIVGAGFVGSTAAYAMMIEGIAREIALIDVNKEKAEGEAMDLEHGLNFVKECKLSFGSSYDLCKNSDIVVVCAGLAQKPGETRLQLVQKNAELFSRIIPEIAKNAPGCIMLIVTNPVDIMTYLAIKYAAGHGFDKRRIFGTGTALDTARLRFLLSEHFHISTKSIHAYILGEHGDSEFPVWSMANVAGLNIRHLDGYEARAMEIIFQKTRKAAYEIISRKGATYYAIGTVITHICKAIINDFNEVVPVSTFIENYYDVSDVCLSVPCIIGKEGVERRIQLPLSQEEVNALRNSGNILKNIIKGIN